MRRMVWFVMTLCVCVFWGAAGPAFAAQDVKLQPQTMTWVEAVDGTCMPELECWSAL